MIRERIKSETAEQHKNVENVGYSSRIMSGELNLDEYKNLILTNLGLNKAFEEQWSALPFDLPAELNIEQRRKTKALEDDARALGLETNVKSEFKFPVNTYEQFMGTLYVFEGSTLGGAIIAKQLIKNQNLSEVSEFNFYNCYGPMIGKLWKNFLDHLTQIKDAEKVDRAIKAAQDTFDITYHAFAQVNKVG